ncbi:xaa-pro aminopeptidase, putative [Entamoeba invadens IP1]|uniref:Xaa-pro aminopeptidase, putative n=1 Tax=Entamoeba invadens IP1 TaxID=370355 RepID=A0A0A1UAP2_ENTIV|nr:xaa-pro aminopeptidase, putative [Entamoeba invadens IP1]ELP90265.1 xaa-pro aminopeptidase, putative [Entamoeba invadens IP1]|eukprot:XP_004257036.1 xaa-pro aminopeptidase, putative [Entamoeba invadens IP1]
MSEYQARLSKLREEMRRSDVSFYVLRISDPHCSEYINSHFKQVEFLCGFTGSAAVVVITQQEALLWTDGRYYIQATAQLPSCYTLMKATEKTTPKVFEYLADNISPSQYVGFDYRTTPSEFYTSLKEKGVPMKDVDFIEQMIGGKLIHLDVYPFLGAQLSVAKKLEQVREVYKNRSVVLTALDDVCWLFNVRGSDVPYIPVAYCFAIVTQERAVLFISDEKKVQTLQHILQIKEANVDVLPYDSFYEKFLELVGDEVAYDAKSTNVRVEQILVGSGKHLFDTIEDLKIMKSVKLEKEVTTTQRLHDIDSKTLCDFFASVNENCVSELDASKYLESLRVQNKEYNGPSFESIIATGKNGAIVHYRATEKQNSVIDWNSLLLCDVGGQYPDGATTDVTRTNYYGSVLNVEEKVRRAYTRVLQGHIDLLMEVFEKTKTAKELDVVAREPLLKENWEYKHGTGHGVGLYMMVHESPPSFRDDKVFHEGMCITIEPGVYLENEFGIRIENQVIVVERDETHFGFESLTKVPYCMKLIMTELLSTEEKKWINTYNKLILRDILPHVESAKTKTWILENTVELI